MKYGVLGSGMQGVAAAYDLAKFGESQQVFLSDIDVNVARDGANKVNSLLGTNVVEAVHLDVTDEKSLKKFLKPIDAVLSAVPYYLNPVLAKASVETKTHFNDLGGSTPTVRKELELDKQAREAGVSIVPDCGLAPGIGNHLGALGIQRMDKCQEVQVRCGGLPQNPKPPLNYCLFFSVEGLVQEYFGPTYAIRNSKFTTIDPFSYLEEIDLPAPLGKCEAFSTAGGTSTCPWTYDGKIETYEYKTIRYPGHYEKIKTLYDLGLFDKAPVNVKGKDVVPYDATAAILDRRLRSAGEPDIVILRVTCRGTTNGKRVENVFEVLDFLDPKTGFSAMARCTAFGATIVTIMQARGEIKPGATPLEICVDQEKYLTELKKRGIVVKEKTKEFGAALKQLDQRRPAPRITKH